MVNCRDGHQLNPHTKAKVLRLPMVNGKIYVKNEQLSLLTPSKEIQSLVDKSRGSKNILVQIGHTHNNVSITKPIVIDHFPQYKFEWNTSLKSCKIFPETWENFKPHISTEVEYKEMILVEKFEKLIHQTSIQIIKDDLEYISNCYRLRKIPELIPEWLLHKYKSLKFNNKIVNLEKFFFPLKFENSFKLNPSEYKNYQILSRYKPILSRTTLLIKLAIDTNYNKPIIVIPTYKMGIRFRKFEKVLIPKLGDKVQKFNLDLLNLTRGLNPLFLDTKSFLFNVIKEDNFKILIKDFDDSVKNLTREFLVKPQDFKDNLEYLYIEPNYWSIYIPKEFKTLEIPENNFKEVEDEIIIFTSTQERIEQLQNLENKISKEIENSKRILQDRPIKFEEINTKVKSVKTIYKILEMVINHYNIYDSLNLKKLFLLIFEAPNCLRSGMLDYFLTQIDFWLTKRSERFLRSLRNLRNSLEHLQEVLQP